MVTKLDRLARSVADLMKTIERIKSRKASLRILAMNLDTESATGKLMISILGSVAEFEREIMLERQREGIAKRPRQTENTKAVPPLPVRRLIRLWN